MPRELTIVGGGLAGLALGIALRDEGVPVTIIEAGRYPRHRVCGEFISGRGQQVLSGLGLEERIVEAGMIHAASAQFHAGRRSSHTISLPQSAWSISRYALDALLADAFRERGGTLRAGIRWSAGYTSEGVVRATGRKPGHSARGNHWFGLKAHADNVRLPSDLELHLTTAGYVGLSRLACGRVNVCGLLRLPPDRPADVYELLQGDVGSVLRQRLNQAAWIDGSRCSTGGLSYGTTRDSEQEFVLGDACNMIPPLTGNGMSMALESASLAVQPLRHYALGLANWPEVRQAVRNGCDQAFRSRLLWGRWLQAGLVRAWCAPLIILAIRGGGILWRTAFERTR